MKKFLLSLCLIFTALLLSSCIHNTTSTNQLCTVKAEKDGLHLKINHSSEYVNYDFYVYDIENRVSNVYLRGGNDKTEYVYPFVKEGKKYEVYAIFRNEDWDWDSRFESNKQVVTAVGGLGDSRIDYSGISYNHNKNITFSDYNFIIPGDRTAYHWESQLFYYTSSPSSYDNIYQWRNTSWDFVQESDWKTGAFELNDDAIQAFSAKKYFWFKYFLGFSFGEENVHFEYEISIEPNYFEYNPESQNSDEEFSNTITSKDGYLKASSTSNGLTLTKNLNNFYENIRIRIYDLTDSRNCPSLCTNNTYTSSTYPFTQSGHEYYIYIEAWDKNWENYLQTEALRIKANGGKGDFIFNYSSVDYDGTDVDNNTVSKIILKDFYMFNPVAAESNNESCKGSIYVGNKSAWDMYEFNNGIVDISKRLSFFRQKTFNLDLQYSFFYSNYEYEYFFVGRNDKDYFDNHELPSLVLDKDFQEVKEWGEYAVTGENTNKKAFLITYNNSWEDRGDVSAVKNSRAVDDDVFGSDCIIADLPKGKIITDNSRAASDDPDYSGYKVGVTKKYFDGKEATLVSIHDHCNIWFYDNNTDYCKTFKSLLSRGKYSYNTIGQYFDKYFELETYVFGSNVPKLQFSNVIKVTDKTKIDLFITDTSETTPYGYYSSKNMYNSSSSNKCEMVYIGVRSFIDFGYGAFNVIMHEFQHLLTDVNKTFSYENGYYSHDYTEMMSCACENILQTLYPDEIKSTTNNLIQSRFSGYGFNGGYMVGVTNWNKLDNSSGYSYGANCAFIDFLMRHFGGVELVRKIVQNNKFNTDAIVEGVRQMGYNETFDSLMMKFALCTVNAGLPEDKAAGGITAAKYIYTDAIVYGQKVKFELMPLYYNWYYAATPSIYNTNDRYEKINFGNYENKGPAIIDNSKFYKWMFAKSFNIKYLGENLSSIEISNPGNNIDLGIAFIE